MSSHKSHISGTLLVLVGSIAYSTKAIFVKLGFRYGLDPITILSIRMLMTVPVFAWILYRTYPRGEFRLKIQRRDHLMLILTGLVGFYISSLFDFYGLKYITASLERIVLFSYPAMVVIFSALLFKKPIGRQKLLALAISYMGLILAFISELGQNQADVTRGTLLVAACAITFSFYYIGSERLIPTFGSRAFTSYALLVATTATTLHFLLTKQISLLYQPSDVYLIIAGMAVFSTVLPTLMIAEGIKRIGAGSASIVTTIGPISTIILAALILGEKVSLLQLLGGALVVCGVLLLGKKPLNKISAKE